MTKNNIRRNKLIWCDQRAKYTNIRKHGMIVIWLKFEAGTLRSSSILAVVASVEHKNKIKTWGKKL